MFASSRLLSMGRAFLVLLVLLFTVQAAFWGIQAQMAKNVETTIRNILEDSNAALNPYYLSQLIAGFEKSHLINCVNLRRLRHEIPFYRSDRNCHSWTGTELLLAGRFHTATLVAANGESWSVRFHSKNGGLFYLSLWLTRIATLAAFALAIAWNRSRVESIQRLEALKAKSLREFSTLASQVAHDIRSPLAALEMIIKGATTLPEEQRLLVRSATSRIRDIANNLLNQNKAESPMPEPVSHQHISALVDLIITEKRIQFRIRSKIEIEVHEQALALFAKVAPSEFKRVLSNLINNSVEALDRGRVSVSIRSTDQNVLVEVRDSGRGIPPEILAKLGQHGISHGKVGTESGSGLGIAHAKKSVENWGGRLEIESEMGKGTAITLFLPKVEAPKWFRPEVTIGNKIPVVVDDDLSILRVWEGRFAPLNIRNHLHFISAESFCDWLDNELNRDGYIFFFDYELLGSSKTGLDLIEKYSLASQSVLVTSHFEEKDIQERAGCLGVGLLPKGLVAFVPIHGSQPKATAYDAVLLDDDKLTHQTWEIAAKSKKKSLRCFVSSQQLFAKLSEIDPSTPFYIDSNLSAGEPRGEEVAKMLFERGYRTLYLATGYEAVDFRDMPWLCAIVGKGPPWIS